MVMSFHYQKLWVIQFYQVFYGNYFELEMSDLERENISRMINGRKLKFFKNLLNKNSLKIARFGVSSIYIFWALKNFSSGE